MSDPRNEVIDPGTSAERLAELAQQHPELGPQIAAHPNAYDGLKEWIAQYATPAAPQQPAQAADAQPTAALPTGPQPGFEQGANQPTTQLPYTGQQPSAPEGFDPTQQQFQNHQQPQQPFPGQQQPYPGQQQPFPGQPGFNAHAPQGFGPGAPFPPGGYGSPDGGAPKKKKKGLIIGLSILLVVILGIGGGLWLFLGSKLGGASTPAAAATKLVDGIKNMDSLSLYGSLAPSEFQPFEAAATSLAQARTGDAEKSAEQFVADIKGAFSITTEGIKTESEPLLTGIERVTFTEGTLTIDSDDPDRAAEIITQYVRDNFDGFDEYGGFDSMAQELSDELKNELPITIDFAKMPDETGLAFTLVTVEEGGSWYVSPMLTAADYVYLSASAYSSSPAPLGTEIVAAAPADSPELAMENLVDTVVGFDGNASRLVQDLAAQMPLAERRLLSIYGEPLVSSMFPYGASSGFDGVEVFEQQYTSTKEGKSARVDVDVLDIGTIETRQGLELRNGVTIEGHCATVTSEYAFDQSYDYRTQDWQKQSYTDRGCLTDIPLAKELGFDQFSIIAAQENGGWFISPIGTLADMSTIVSERIIKLAEEGKLDDLYGSSQGFGYGYGF